jgi:EAL domain-containing protein (putative c-di-GMP-specific phosphodiesterase class I)
LMRSSDVAMYAAKAQGKNAHVLYTPMLAGKGREKLEIESALHKAIERDELVLHYQPKVDARSVSMVGVEALMRWRRNGVLVPPGEFIPLAEETHLIVPLGAWVLDEACRQAAHWRKQFPDQPERYVSVNVTGAQLQRAQFIDEVTHALTSSGLPANCLMLEVTESSLLEDSTTNAQRLQALRDLGVRLAIDDFGTGYSGLAYLKRFPIDTVKIDQSFVRDLTVDPDDAAIVTAIVAMAKSLGIDVVAEGVETEQQLNYLRELGCNRAQGFFLARPMSAKDITRLLGKPPAATAAAD